MTGLSFQRVVLRVLTFVLALSPFTVERVIARQVNAEALYQDARRLFESLEYDKAVVALDEAIAALQAAPASDGSRRERLASAYEMRARSKFGLGDQEGAKRDFVLLLQLAPGYTLSGQVSPRVVALFEETVRQTVTSLTVSVSPATAKLELDGAPLAGPGTIRVAAGEHVLSAAQPGFRPAKQNVTAVAETPAEMTLTLERISSVVQVLTIPGDVEVKIDGKVVGRTASGTETVGGASAASSSLVVSDVATGSHSVELRRDCFVAVTQRLEIERPDDYTIGPVTLSRAVATLSINADQPDARVFIDGLDRGVAPVKVSDVCEGQHVVEVRGQYGSDSTRIDARAAAEVTVDAVLKPVFAIVSASGPSAGPQDLRVLVERAFAGSATLRLVAPPAADAEKALKESQLSSDWLAIDAGGRAIGASAQLSGAVRHDVSSKLSNVFHSQGVASVTAAGGSRVIVALLTAGSGLPDVVDVSLDDQSSIAAAISRLDGAVALSQPSVGLQAIDVADVQGAVVVSAEAKATAAGVTAGDVVVQADGKPVSDAAAFSAIVAAHRRGDTLKVEVRDASSGAAKPVDLPVTATPRVMSLYESGMLANRLLIDLRARLARTNDPFEQSVIRLNMGVVLGRLEDWRAAREELQRVELPEQSTVGAGTVQYLIGLGAEKTGNRAEAEAAFKAAAGTGHLLTEYGPPVRELAEARLAELMKGSR